MAELPGVALITGAASGIGQATASAFVKAGCTRLTLVDMNGEGLLRTRTQILQINGNAQVTSSAGDITDPEFVELMIKSVLERFGRLDYGVNCAGVLGPPATSQEVSLDEHDRVMNVNYRGAFLCTRAEVRVMMKNEPSGFDDIPGQRGAIVNIASALGIKAKSGARKLNFSRPCKIRPAIFQKSAAYCASKAAVIGLTRAEAIDCSPYGIRVNCVCPGLIDTPLATFNGDPAILKMLEPVRDIAPMKRWGQPREVADAIVFLCSSRASFVQGHALAVDGGYLLQ